MQAFSQCLRHYTLIPCLHCFSLELHCCMITFQIEPHVFFISCASGVTRLADISLNDPIRISIADEVRKSLKPALQREKEANGSSNCMEQENFAVPEKLKQYFMMVPSKLRLVTLAAFILEKCMVRLLFAFMLSSLLLISTLTSLSLSRLVWITYKALNLRLSC